MNIWPIHFEVINKKKLIRVAKISFAAKYSTKSAAIFRWCPKNITDLATYVSIRLCR